MPKTFTVSKDYNNCRFDRWFKLNIGKYPQSLIERLIRKKKIKVNKINIKPIRVNVEELYKSGPMKK